MNRTYRWIVSVSVITAFVFGLWTAPVAASSQTAKVTASTLNVRKGAGLSYTSVATLHSGDTVKVLSSSGGWVKVSVSGHTGYVNAAYLKMSTSSSGSALKSGDTGSSVKTLQNNLIKLGYLSTTATGNFGPATQAAVKKFQKDHGLTADGVAGQRTLDKITAALKSKSNTVKVVAGSTSVTLKMGSSGKNVTDMQKALKVLGYFSGDVTGFFGAQTRAAVMKFQKANKLKADGVAGSTTLKKLYGGSVKASEADNEDDDNSVLRNGVTSDEVENLQKKLKEKGYFHGEITGYFGDLTEEAVREFQKANGLTVDGMAGDDTLNKLYSTSGHNNNDKCEIADWWTVVSKVFKRGDVATVTDVKTGVSYKVYRMGGTNHADVEPLTAEDTAKLKDTYGGHWSWDRRAVWVDIDGRRFAGSTNGMPHGGDTKPYNNMRGQVCIHFLNSKTHCSGRVDARHQAMVHYAYEVGNK